MKQANLLPTYPPHFLARLSMIRGMEGFSQGGKKANAYKCGKTNGIYSGREFAEGVKELGSSSTYLSIQLQMEIEELLNGRNWIR
jgi:hypothetical protein